MIEVLDAFLKEVELKINKTTENLNDLKNISKEMIDQLKKEKDFNEKIVETFKKFQVIDSDIIRLNVGGSPFSTLKSTLTKKIRNPTTEEYYKPNILEGLVNGYIEPKYDENKAIFIDRNPKYFGYILDYLRMANTENEFELPGDFSLKDFKKEVQYYNIEGLIELIGVNFDSVILNQIQGTQLMNYCGFSVKDSWKLLYRGSRDGFAASSFHQKCDNISKTLTIVKSTAGYIFGGYTDVAWDQSGTYKTGTNTFIFSLVNSSNNPGKFLNKIPSYGIHCTSTYGPTFGRGHDFHICNNSNSCSSSYSNLGHSYYFNLYENGTTQAQSYLAGAYNFQVSEVEVFQKTT